MRLLVDLACAQDGVEELEDATLQDPSPAEQNDEIQSDVTKLPLIMQLCASFEDNKVGCAKLLLPMFLKIHNNLIFLVVFSDETNGYM